jgi:predicted transcriptional regulator
MKTLKIGIASQEKIRARVLGIARGKIKPKASDPKIWFTSMRSLSQVLSDENRALLDVFAPRGRLQSVNWRISQGASKATCRAP